MKYLETSQIIPSKGMSYTMYEVEGEDKIIRMLTTIPDVDEIHIYPKPPVKKLYKPEMCKSVEANEFLGLWAMGEERKKGSQSIINRIISEKKIPLIVKPSI